MKTNRFLILILLLLCALLCACGAGSGTTTAPETTAPPETTEATEATTEPTEATTEATEPSTEAPTEVTQAPEIEDEISVRTEMNGEVLFRIYPAWFKPTGEEREYMRDLLTKVIDEPNRWYIRAMDSLFTTPADVNLDSFFLGGVWLQSQQLTDNEKELLKQQVSPDFVDELDATRLSQDQVDALLEAFFEIELEETNRIGMDGWFYLTETDCYYRFGGGASGSFVTLHSVYAQEDGTYHVYYSDTPENAKKLYPTYLLILEPHVDGFDLRFRMRANVITKEYMEGCARSAKFRQYPDVE